MSRCPFAIWKPLTGASGSHLGGPFKIVHHTTEGSTAEGAMNAFVSRRSDPHFTVDATRIFQHVDTSLAARALRNPPGGVETNRDSAVQIELVGFAHLPKDPRALTNVARLCRWIESVHGVPRSWPAGLPKPAKDGKDPGGHNRDPLVWDTRAGHYGHCHVPENTHWDPAYSRAEAAFLMDATFDAEGRLVSPEPPAVPARARRGRKRPAGAPISTMPDHDLVPVGLGAYIRDLALPAAPPAPTAAPANRKARPKAAPARRRTPALAPGVAAKVDVGSLLSFVDGVGEQEREDVLYAVQLAQRGASGTFDRFTQAQSWYQKYVEILENLGWAVDQLAFTRFDQAEGEFRMDHAALAIVTSIATPSQLAVLQEAVSALSGLAEDDGAIRLFDFHSSMEGCGNFQLGSVQRSAEGALSMALGAFHFRSVDQRKRFLFLRWGSRQVHLWTAAQRMTLNADFYARRRADVIAKLEADAQTFIADLKLRSR